MIFIQKFKQHIKKHPRIATAFEEFKTSAIQWYCENQSAEKSAEYKNAISNFMHGAFRCTEKTEFITSWGRLRLRTANIDDYDFIDAAERDDDNKSWIGNWSLGGRIEKFGDNNFFQTIIETAENRRVGFIDFRDMMNDTQIELKRFAITEKRNGFGKETMYLSQKFAFEILGRNKLYLGTKDENIRAQNLYHSTGFVLSSPESIALFHICKTFLYETGVT
ncbi:MAG: GNAT family N-acetyltransferase [Clostridiales bacterium]|jgi:RimJ/RimL family protein N-acetyltransferase|nr:GNAT family N-acetyltransferase [Clostridiales bacterium]